MNHQQIPSDYMIRAKQLRALGFSMSAVYRASLQGGGITPLEKPEDEASVLPPSKSHAFRVTP